MPSRSFIKESLEVVRPAPYSRAHWSGRGVHGLHAARTLCAPAPDLSTTGVRTRRQGDRCHVVARWAICRGDGLKGRVKLEKVSDPIADFRCFQRLGPQGGDRLAQWEAAARTTIGGAARQESRSSRARRSEAIKETGRRSVPMDEKESEGEGFEPPERLPVQWFSRPPPSTTRPSLRIEILATIRAADANQSRLTPSV